MSKPKNLLPKNTETRESWLRRAAEKIDALIKKAGFEPQPIHVSIGFPSRNSRPSARQRIGECWRATTSSDSVAHIFISPLLHDPIEVIDTLAHEQCHAATPGAGHKGAFVKLTQAIGLTEGPPTAASAGPELRATLKKMLAELGPFPHPKLAMATEIKVQSTRMLKLECGSCGCIVRMTRKWLEIAVPSCGCGGEFEVEAN